MHGITKNIPEDEINISGEIKKILIPKNMGIDINVSDCEIVKLDSILSLETYLAAEYHKFDTVLFSCGGSSFSDFKDYKYRGLFFKKIVSNLKGNTR